MRLVVFFPFTPLLAEGGGAAQGAIFFLGLFSGFIAAGFGVRTLRKRRRFVVSLIVSLVALFLTAEIAYVFGLPYDRSDFTGYIPWIPLVLATCGLIFTAVGAIAQSMVE